MTVMELILNAATELSKKSGKTAPSRQDLTDGLEVSRMTLHRWSKGGAISADTLVKLIRFFISWYNPTEGSVKGFIGMVMVLLFPELVKK